MRPRVADRGLREFGLGVSTARVAEEIVTESSSHGAFAGLLRRGAWLLALLLAVLQPAMALADSVQYLYDPGGRLIAVLDPVNGAAQYTYDKAGNITAITRIAPTTVTALQFYPTRATVGTTVTISGTGYGTTADTTVKFNATTAVPIAVTPNTITVAVPTGATTGVLTVTAPNGTATTTASFTVAGPVSGPAITSFSPTTQVQGQSVTITGARFDTTSSKVYVNGQSAPITAATTTSITFTVPAASTGKIVVQTPVGTATSASYLVVPPPSYSVASVFATQQVPLTATPVSTNTGTTGSISLAFFDVAAGQRLTIHLDDHLVPGAPNIAVIGPSGAPIYPFAPQGANDMWYGPVTLPQAGTYTVAMAPGTATPGTFAAMIYVVQGDIAKTLAVDGPMQTALIKTPGQQGVFSFSGTAGQTVSFWFDFSQMTGCSTYVIQNPDGSYIKFPTATCANGIFPIGPLSLPQTGTVQVTAIPSLSTDISAFGPIAGRVFSVPADAGPVAIGSTGAMLPLTAPGQKGSFSFTGTAGTKISVQLDFSQIGVCSDYAVKNPDNTDLVPTTQGCSSLFAAGGVLTLGQTGTYTINVSPRLSEASKVYSGTGLAFARVFTVPSDLTPTLDTVGTTVSMALGAPGQQLSPRFSGSVGQTVSIQLDFSELSTACATYSVVNQTTAQTLVPPTRACSYVYVSGAPITLAAAGTYVINVVPDLSDGTSGRGSVSATVFTVPADATAPVTVGGPLVTLQAVTPGQRAFFTFSGTAGQKVSALLNLVRVRGCSVVSIMGPSGTVPFPPVNTCANSYSTGAVTLPLTGAYRIIDAPVLTDGKLPNGLGWVDATLSSSP